MIFDSLFKRRKLHLLGDSHAGQLIGLKDNFTRLDIELCSVQGATASGLANPHSTTLAGPILKEYIDKKIASRDFVLVHLGEVDCGFLMWVKAERDHVNIEDQLDFALKNYQSLLLQIMQKTNRVLVLSVIPPTIKDGVKIGNVANLRGQIKATQKERTQLTAEMNRRLALFCSQHKMRFVDLQDVLIDSATNVVREEFLNLNPEDHHLNPIRLVEVVSSKLKRIV